MGDLNNLQCGTDSSYTNGCRCELCKKAHSTYHRIWRSKNRAHVNAQKRKARLENPDKYKGIAKRSYDKHKKARLQKQREGRLRREYGITQADYLYMVDAQSGKCAICGNTPKSQKLFHIDHDHNTGKVRMLLCSTCNSQLGWYETNKHSVDTYLQKFNG